MKKERYIYHHSILKVIYESNCLLFSNRFVNAKKKKNIHVHCNMNPFNKEHDFFNKLALGCLYNDNEIEEILNNKEKKTALYKNDSYKAAKSKIIDSFFDLIRLNCINIDSASQINHSIEKIHVTSEGELKYLSNYFTNLDYRNKKENSKDLITKITQYAFYIISTVGIIASILTK